MLELHAGIPQRPHDLERGGDPGNAVEAAARGNGVAVRADRNDPARGILARGRPIRLPAVSMRTVSPASAKRRASQSRPDRNSGLNERRV
jgi:hypothetical protein